LVSFILKLKNILLIYDLVKMRGYFHYKKKDQVLTAYYDISAEEGMLKYSCSLWRKKTRSEMWDRKLENAHALANLDNGMYVHHIFKEFDQGGLKIDDVWLRKYIHVQLTKHGRSVPEIIESEEIGQDAFKTIEECHKIRGHSLHSNDRSNDQRPWYQFW